LVALSVVLSLASAYAALDFAGRVTAARRWHRSLWLAGGAMAMGLGIWAMHYVGMLALDLPVPVFYHYPTVALSLLAAVAASTVALSTVSRERMGAAQEISGSIIMGGGIATMHYIGMAAMRLPAMMDYRWGRVALSLVLAIAISYAALVLSFRVRQEQKTSLRKIISAVVMGSAIPLMHYTGMWAVEFRATDAPFSTEHAVRISLLGAISIAVVSFLILMLAIGTAFLDRVLAAEKATLEAARESEVQFRTLAEAIPQVVWTAGADGLTDYMNKRWYEMSGKTEAESLGSGWVEVIHPDDRIVCLEDWQKALRAGATFEVEYRLRDAAKGYRWYLDRAVPMRDSNGAVVKWFGTCTDIEDQRRQMQLLEEQIKERTEELATSNQRLEQEMLERDVTRRELDLQNERMVRELTQRSERATLLAQMGEVLQSCVNRDEAFAAALGFAPKIFPVTRGAIVLLNPARSLAEVTGSWADCLLPVSVFEPNACWALRTGHAHLVEAGDLTAPCAHAAGVKNTYLCLPILAQGEAIGILHFQTTDYAPTIAPAELSFKTTFAGQLGLSIANIRLREALRSQSIKDPLTGLYNRRYLEEMLEREIRRAVRADQSLGILILDLDHFKKFNDTYGHDAGDTVLKTAGSFLTNNVRAEDIVCRFGGEEFVVILPTANVEAARARGERIRSKLRELAVLHQGQSLGRVTVSVGVSALPTHGTSGKELLAAADAALYSAKREGRDRVVIAADPPPEEKELSTTVAAASAVLS
jgi:diguanylate cyclase (GGDEF)-like protein/PAS domain S-box-containing protein